MKATHPSKGEKELTVVRVGTVTDFMNDGRVYMRYQAPKPGCKFKLETHHFWASPDELVLAPLAGQDASPHSSEQTRTVQQQQELQRGREREVRSEELPAGAAHERARKLPQKKAAPITGRQHGAKTATSKVSLVTRVQQFPDHSLVIGIEGKLRCVACKHTIPNKWSTIDLHCRMTHKGHPTRHAVNLQAMELRKEDDSELKEELSAYYELHPEEQGGTMMLTDANETVFRYRVVETILPSGTPLTVVDMFRPLLQRAGFALTDSAHLQVYIPRIEEKEDTKINVEIAGQYLSIAFDGTTRLGEAINIVARFCSESFELKKRLLDFHTLAKHANAVQLAAHTLDVVVRKRNVPASYVVGLSRDSVAVNGAACRRLMVTMTSACDLLCICHTLCHVGARFELTVLDKFMTPWLELVGGRSPHAGAKMLWKESVSPAVVPGYSNVRWYAKAEIIFVIGEAGTRRLRDFLVELENRDYGEATTDKMLEIYNQEGDTLRLQIAAMLDIRILVRTTYEMEGFRLEILLTFHRIQILRALGRSIKNQDDGVLPNVDGVLRVLMTLKKGVRFEKFFHGHGIAVGTLSSEETIASSLYRTRPPRLALHLPRRPSRTF